MRTDMRIFEKNIKTINNIKEKNKIVIEASMMSKKGIEELKNKIVELFKINEISSGSEMIITNIRHKNQIHNSLESIEKAIIKESILRCHILETQSYISVPKYMTQ